MRQTVRAITHFRELEWTEVPLVPRHDPSVLASPDFTSITNTPQQSNDNHGNGALALQVSDAARLHRRTK